MTTFVAMKRFISIFSIAVMALIASSCGNRGLKAHKAFEIGEYDRAATLYAKALLGEKNKYNQGVYNFQMGECYRRKGMYRQAASAYGKADRLKYRDNIIYLRLGDCFRATGNFEKALENYEMYKIVAPANARFADAGIEACKLAMAKWETMTGYDYKNAPDSGYVLTLAKQFNSKFSDYCPAYVDDEYEIVYFTSMRVPKRRRKLNRVTGQSNSTIYMSKVDGKGDWTEPEMIGEPFDIKMDDGTPSITSDGKTMFFTRCPYKGDTENNAECYETTRSGGRWGELKRVMPGGDSTMMVAHPAISPDGQTLFFVSDKDGGVGGKDIYYTTKNTDGSWSEAVNAGGIVNTSGDEMFPYVRSNGDLYFSSNGHGGYGGFDIFRAVKNEAGRYVISNMDVPINSQGDDFGIVFKGNKEEGLFTSNRGNKAIDNLYTFVLPEVILVYEGRLTDSDGKALPKAFVKVIGSDGTNQKLKPSEEGTFGFRAEPNTTYLIQCGARGYVNQKITVSTQGKKKSENIVLDVKLQKNL